MTWPSPGAAGGPLVAVLGRLGGLLDRLDAIFGCLGVFLGHRGGVGGLPWPSWKTEARIICCSARDRGFGSADLCFLQRIVVLGERIIFVWGGEGEEGRFSKDGCGGGGGVGFIKHSRSFHQTAESILSRPNAPRARWRINITGQWVEAKLAGGLRFQAPGVADESPNWMTFGKVQVKVAHGHTRQGIQYLNFYVKHLGHAGFAVGGLLGEDDHKDVMIPPAICAHQTSLNKVVQGGGNVSSVAMATSE